MLFALVWLNMALQPCLMAAEPLLPTQHHDSGCPHCPEDSGSHCDDSDPGRCAYIDAIDFDGRSAVVPDPTDNWAAGCDIAEPKVGDPPIAETHPSRAEPIPATGPPIFLRNCSFLN